VEFLFFACFEKNAYKNGRHSANSVKNTCTSYLENRICQKMSKNLNEKRNDSRNGKVLFLGMRCQPVKYLIDVKKVEILYAILEVF
jgi:hypothetical protein